MQRNETWLKLYRSMLDWEWYQDINTKVLFLHLLLIVNIRPQRKLGMSIPAGSIDKTQEQLATETGLTLRQLRTAISKLKLTGELTVVRGSKFSVYTLKNWSRYQAERQKIVRSFDSRATVERQKSDSLNKNNKNLKNRKKEEALPPEEEEDLTAWEELEDDAATEH
jgi:hypothetical protein